MRVVYITVRDAGDAKKISHALLHKKLVACTNIFPIESMFWWNGEIQENVEFAILAKTTDANYEKVEKAVKDMHEYDVPAIYSWKPDKVSKEYNTWVRSNCK